MSSRRQPPGPGDDGPLDRGPLPPPPQEPGRGGDDKEKAPLPGEGDSLVLLDTELDDGKVWLVLANPDDCTAFEVKVDFTGPLKGPGGEVDLTEKRIFRGLPVLRPRIRIRILVDTARQLFADDDRETRFQARVSWRSRHGETFARTFRHDLRIWEDLGEVD